jgi:hypothetical protein
MSASTEQGAESGRWDGAGPPETPEYSRRMVVPALVVFALGLFALLLYCATLPAGSRWGAFGAGIGVGVAATALGAVLGFLFGIPRSLQGNGTEAVEPGVTGYRPNTNLEQISDWLTKILVGVGLVQIGNAGDWAGRLVHSVGEALGGTATARVVAGATLVLYTIWGFLTCYLLTRTWVTRTLYASDLDLVATRAAQLAAGQVQEALDERAKADAEALALVDRVLDPPPGTPPVGRPQLDQAVADASDTVRVQVFYRARQRRQSTWRDQKERMALTIPVFRALIAADAEGRFHRNHAQLGFALKDLTEPAWREAEEALSEAIRRRGPSEKGWLLYEFNRAICRVHLDPTSTGPSDPDVRRAVLDDIRATARSRQLVTQLRQLPEVADWLTRNDVQPDELS